MFSELLANKNRILAASLVLAAGSIGLNGCSEYNNERGKGDVPIGDVHESPRQIWENVDGFPNISAFCIGENGVYTNTGDGRDPAEIVVNDPNCDEGGLLYEK